MTWPISDTFDEASDTNIGSHTADTGQSWASEFSGASLGNFNSNFLINAATKTAITGSTIDFNSIRYVNDPAPGVDYAVEADYIMTSTANFIQAMLVGRMVVGDNDFYSAELDPNPAAIILRRFDNGGAGFVTLSSSSVTISAGNTYRVQLYLTDALKKAVFDLGGGGELEVTSTDNSVPGAGYAGMLERGLTTTALHLDNFDAYELTTDLTLSGTPQSQSATAAGSVSAEIDASGTPSSQAASASGAVDSGVAASGTPAAQSSTASGSVGVENDAAGAVVSQSAQASGSVVVNAALDFDIINAITEEATPGVNVGSSQGVCKAGSWFYTTGNDSDQREIRVWNSSWVEQTGLKVSTELDESGLAQCNGMFYDSVAEKLYVGANNFNTTPELGWILEYDVNLSTGALSFVASHSVGAIWAEGCCIGPDGKFWVHHHQDATIHRYTTGWTLDKVLTPPLKPEKSAVAFYQGARFIDGVLYCNTHGNSGGGLDAYVWDQANDRLLWALLTLPVPTDCTQGIDLDGSDLWMAERTGNDHTTANNVVRASYTQVPLPPVLLDHDAAQGEAVVNTLTISSFAPPPGNNRIAIVFASWEQNAPASAQSVASLTWGSGNEATPIGAGDFFNPDASSVHNGLAAYYFLDADFPLVAEDITIVLDQDTQVGGNDLHLVVAVFDGVDQTTPIEGLVAENDLSVDVVTSGDSRLLINCITNGNAGTAPANAQYTIEDATLDEFVSRMSGKAALDSGTFTLGWTDADSVRPITLGFALVSDVTIFDVSGAVSATASSAVGVATSTPEASGSPQAAPATASGAAAPGVDASGDVNAQASTASGAADPLAAASGAPVAQSATSTGSADPQGDASGDVISGDATASGQATPDGTFVSGAVTAQPSAASGAAESIPAAQGAVQSQDAATSGAADVIVIVTGNVMADDANTSGSADVVADVSGSVQSGLAGVSGLATPIVNVTGAVSSDSASANGAVVQTGQSTDHQTVNVELLFTQQRSLTGGFIQTINMDG